MEVVGAAGGEERFHPADCRGGFDEASSQRGGPASPLKPVSHAGQVGVRSLNCASGSLLKKGLKPKSPGSLIPAQVKGGERRSVQPKA